MSILNNTFDDMQKQPRSISDSFQDSLRTKVCYLEVLQQCTCNEYHFLGLDVIAFL